MLRRPFLLILVMAFLAGPALAAHSACGTAACAHNTMQSASGGDCNGDGMAAGACTLHCGSVWSVPAAISAVHATVADALPFTPAAPAVRCLAGPPDPAPPKA